MSRSRILCVDDEPRILEGLALHLGRRYEVHRATSGAAGLELLESEGPFAVVISDMRMPVMDGAAFLAQVHERWPETVRMLLTGFSDMTAAAAAVNDGGVFRFLTKPCPTKKLRAALDDALAQHRLLTAERDIKERTLTGIVQVLGEILSMAQPSAFSRAMRCRELALATCRELQREEPWQMEVAVMLSQLGWITVPEQTLERWRRGDRLEPGEDEMLQRLPTVASRMIERIPRMESVAEIIRLQGLARELGQRGETDGDEVPLETHVLNVVFDFDALVRTGMSQGRALGELLESDEGYHPDAIAALTTAVGRAPETSSRLVDIGSLREGMVLDQDVCSIGGTLLVARGSAITAALLERLSNWHHVNGLEGPVRVRVDEKNRSWDVDALRGAGPDEIVTASVT